MWPVVNSHEQKAPRSNRRRRSLRPTTSDRPPPCRLAPTGSEPPKLLQASLYLNPVYLRKKFGILNVLGQGWAAKIQYCTQYYVNTWYHLLPHVALMSDHMEIGQV